MSRFTYYDDNSRFDSVQDLSHNHGIASYDFEDSQTIPASSDVPSGPWSEYNTRLEPGHPAPPATSEWLSDTNTFIETNPPSYHMEAYEGCIVPYGSDLPCDSPDPESPSSCSHPPTPPLRPLWTAVSSATVPSTMRTSNHGDTNAIQCGQCNQRFTGTYRQGNLARHVKQQHTKATERPYVCTADGCSKVFRRQDARLKHAREKHPELHLPPVQRRHGTEHCSTASFAHEAIPTTSNLEHNIGQWSQEQQYSTGNCTSKLRHESNPSVAIHKQPCIAQCVFATMQANLSLSEYSRICDSFFTRWESIVQQLSDDHSDAYPVYAQVLEDIYAVVQTVDFAAYSSTCITGPDHFHNRAPNNQRAGPRGNGSPGLGSSTGITSQTDRIFKHNERKPSLANGSGKNIVAVLAENAVKSEDIKVDCPVFKHHVMHGTSPPCRGCRVGSMSQVRNHLNPERAVGTHDGYPAFVKQCSRCKEDFIEKRAYDDHKAANDCESQNQLRGQIEVPWARQYLKLYPHAVRVPLPWPGQRGWLPDWIVTQSRSPRGVPTSSSPFLGEQRSASRSSHTQTPLVVNSPPRTPGYNAAANLMLQDIITPAYIQSRHSPASVRNSDFPGTMGALETSVLGEFDNNPQHWQNVLESLATHQGRLIDAAMYLTPEQLRHMANEAAEMYFLALRAEQRYNFPGAMYAQHQPDQAQAQAPPSTLYEHPDGSGNPAYATPAPHQPLPAANYMTPSTSTQPSSVLYGTGSSRHPNSMLTGPSSTFEPVDPTLLSPWSPTNYRRTSLPSGNMEDNTHLRRSIPSRISLPERHGHALSLYMNPSVPNTPDDNDENFPQLPRRLFDRRS